MFPKLKNAKNIKHKKTVSIIMHVINTVNHPGSTKLSTHYNKKIPTVNSVARLTVGIRA